MTIKPSLCLTYVTSKQNLLFIYILFTTLQVPFNGHVYSDILHMVTLILTTTYKVDTIIIPHLFLDEDAKAQIN